MFLINSPLTKSFSWAQKNPRPNNISTQMKENLALLKGRGCTVLLIKRKDKMVPFPSYPSIFSPLPLFLFISLHNQIQPNADPLYHLEAMMKTNGGEVEQQQEHDGYHDHSFPWWFKWRPPHLSSIFLFFSFFFVY